MGTARDRSRSADVQRRAARRPESHPAASRYSGAQFRSVSSRGYCPGSRCARARPSGGAQEARLARRHLATLTFPQGIFERAHDGRGSFSSGCHAGPSIHRDRRAHRCGQDEPGAQALRGAFRGFGVGAGVRESFSRAVLSQPPRGRFSHSALFLKTIF